MDEDFPNDLLWNIFEIEDEALSSIDKEIREEFEKKSHKVIEELKEEVRTYISNVKREQICELLRRQKEAELDELINKVSKKAMMKLRKQLEETINDLANVAYQRFLQEIIERLGRRYKVNEQVLKQVIEYYEKKRKDELISSHKRVMILFIKFQVKMAELLAILEVNCQDSGAAT